MAKHKTIEITLYLSELLHDIAQKTYFSAHNDPSREVSLVANLIADERPAVREQVLAMIDTALYQASHKLAEWIREDNREGNNLLDAKPESEAIVLHLSLPHNFNEAMTQTLASLLHSYIVAEVLYAWYSLQSYELGIATANKERTALLDEIRLASYQRRRPIKPINRTTTIT